MGVAQMKTAEHKPAAPSKASRPNRNVRLLLETEKNASNGRARQLAISRLARSGLPRGKGKMQLSRSGIADPSVLILPLAGFNLAHDKGRYGALSLNQTKTHQGFNID